MSYHNNHHQKKDARIVKSSFLVLIAVLCIGCVCQSPVIRQPDMNRFNSLVFSESLRDSLAKQTITPGMPYFVVRDLYQNSGRCEKNLRIPVASLGSKQRLQESEGLDRTSVDPNIKIFMDLYNTVNGKLHVWYQYPDFYRTQVSVNDTLLVFLKDTVLTAVIECLKSSNVLCVRDSLPLVDTAKNYYAEIHYFDHSWRKKSYWYTLRILPDQKSVLLKALNFELYPIEWLELNGESVSFFKWR